MALLALPLLAVLAGLSAYYLPIRQYLPKCLFHELTGLYCAGCGGTRAFYALIHGDILKALGYNAFLVLLLPIAFYFYLAATMRVFFNNTFLPVPSRTTRWLWGLLFAAILFMVLRNIPLFPFTLLKP